MTNDGFVDRLHLIDKLVDQVVVQADQFHRPNHHLTTFFVGRFDFFRDVFTGLQQGHAILLDLMQAAVGACDDVQRFHDIIAQNAFHRGERNAVVFVIIVVIGRSLSAFCALFAFLVFVLVVLFTVGKTFGRSDIQRRVIRVFVAGKRAHVRGIGRVEIDHVPQQNDFFLQRLPPGHKRGERQRRLANAGDHVFTASFDPLGNGNFAFA